MRHTRRPATLLVTQPAGQNAGPDAGQNVEQNAGPDADTAWQAAWEAAYARFATPEQEVRKFIRRLTKLGAAEWPPTARIVELFCGRGNGLHALHRLGFRRIHGADLSASLLAHYRGPAACYQCDCRHLPFKTDSQDIVIVQGGLHHLPSLPDDLLQTLAEIKRVLRPGGLCVLVEPWLTPFLSVVHAVCRIRLARRLFPKLDAFAVMTHYEQHTYEQWLGQPQAILAILSDAFQTQRCSLAWGKCMFVGRKAEDSPRVSMPESQ